MRNHDQLYINGAWVSSTGTDTIDVLDASTEEVMGHVPLGTAEDVDAAVAAARVAFDTWSLTPPADRADCLLAIQGALAARMDELAEVVTGEVGMPLGMSKMIQAGLPVGEFGNYAQMAKDFVFEEKIGNSIVVREPIGVVGCITPWNYPLYQIALKVAAAMAAGCTVVLKPSEVAPFNAFILAEAIHASGLPAGVFNLVSGLGPVVGEAIAAHPDVDMVSFTGSTRAGRRVMEVGAQTIKKIALELGGKSANILLDDLDDDAMAKAVGKGIGAAFMNSGQTCSALTRMLVPASRHEAVMDVAAQQLAGWTIGDPKTNAGRLGPVISDAQRTRVRGFIDKGIGEGATLVGGGSEQPDDLAQGYYVKPTIFANVTPDMTIAQEEIFGPVLVIMPYADDDDAVRIANSTPYGLSGGVTGADPERAQAIARRLRTGQVDVNGGGFNTMAPFGGYKQSGNGRERGRYGFEEFLEVKAMQL